VVLGGQAQEAKYYNVKKKVAIGGYDPVSYFDNDPQAGESTHSTIKDGVKYLFISAANKSKFDKSPKNYMPQYGGWCAYAMGANGDKVKIDPETYKIVAGKLYLFYNFYFTNTLDSWNEEESTLKEKADHNWEKIIK
jgi:YHS domain-containing protein